MIINAHGHLPSGKLTSSTSETRRRYSDFEPK